MAAASLLLLLNLVRCVYLTLAGTVKHLRPDRKTKNMTPAAFTQTDMVRDTATAPRFEQGALRLTRNTRRFQGFTAEAQTTLFHAWRP